MIQACLLNQKTVEKMVEALVIYIVRQFAFEESGTSEVHSPGDYSVAYTSETSDYIYQQAPCDSPGDLKTCPDHQWSDRLSISKAKDVLG